MKVIKKPLLLGGNRRSNLAPISDDEWCDKADWTDVSCFVTTNLRKHVLNLNIKKQDNEEGSGTQVKLSSSGGS